MPSSVDTHQRIQRKSPIATLSGVELGDSESNTIDGMQILTRTADIAPYENFICDVSAIRKRLAAGKAAPQWLQQQFGHCPTALFEHHALTDDAYIVRIHRDQYLLVGGHGDATLDAVFAMPNGRHGDVLLLDYECAEVALGGPDVETVMSELCPLPLEAVNSDQWCATRMAHADVVISVINQPTRHYRVILTPADARFVFGILLDAIGEYGGRQIGFENYWHEFYRGGTDR